MLDSQSDRTTSQSVTLSSQKYDPKTLDETKEKEDKTDTNDVVKETEPVVTEADECEADQEKKVSITEEVKDPCNVAMLQICKLAMLHCCNVVMLECCKLAMLQSCQVAKLYCCNVEMLQSSIIALYQNYNVAKLQC